MEKRLVMLELWRPPLAGEREVRVIGGLFDADQGVGFGQRALGGGDVGTALEEL